MKAWSRGRKHGGVPPLVLAGGAVLSTGLLLLSRCFAELAAIGCTRTVVCHLRGTAINTSAQTVLLRQYFRAVLCGKHFARNEGNSGKESEQNNQQHFFTEHEASSSDV